MAIGGTDLNVCPCLHVISGAGLIDIELARRGRRLRRANGEEKARQFGTLGYSIRAAKPGP